MTNGRVSSVTTPGQSTITTNPSADATVWGMWGNPIRNLELLRLTPATATKYQIHLRIPLLRI